MKFPTLAVCFYSFVTSAALSAEQYFCETTVVSGLHYSETSKEWEATKFPPKERYVISRPTAASLFSDAAFVITLLGKDVPWGRCDESFNSAGFLRCDLFGEFIFNRKSLRFISTYLFGYTNGVDENSNNPYVAIGKCSPF